MKITISSLLSVIFLFCIQQNAHSQFLSLDPKKEEYLPSYNNTANKISPNVKMWIEEELAKNYETKTIEMKTDVMGRLKPIGLSGNRTESEYKQVAMPKQKRRVMISDMHIPEINVEPVYARYEYNLETKKYDYFFNGKKMSEKEYFGIIEERNKKFDLQKKGKRNLPISGVTHSADDRYWIALMTAEEILELTKNYKELAIDDYREPISTANVVSILSTLQLSTIAFPSNQGQGVGVYLSEWDCYHPTFGILNSANYTMANSCNGGTPKSHHNLVASVVQSASPSAHVFGFNGPVTHPSNPSSYYPPIEVGNHSYCYYPFGTPTMYGIFDANLDNYVYLHRVINFVGAGNVGPYGNCDLDTYNVTSPGKALNVITVGAVHSGYPAANNYTNYSAWGNPDVGNEKPEIGMYTDIEMSVGSIDGTSAASPLAAGFMATILSQHPFCKRQPAMMKAALLAAEKMPINNASSWDPYKNNSAVAKGITNYSTAAYGTSGGYWDGGNSSFFNSNEEITFTENNIQANKRYRIAIAWLVPGDYIFNNPDNPKKRISQDIDLIVKQNGNIIAYSESANNPFEVVDFITTSNAPLTVIIRRYSNSGYGNVILGYNINFNH